jgi:SNF2 family DNA or RNA helicase
MTDDPDALRLHLTYRQLHLLRDFDQLLCLEGLSGVEHLPHQIETVRKVLRRFRGRVLLADEVGLGKTIEACLLLREYLLRGLAKRILILVPTPLVSQWHEELASKFHLDFSIPGRSGQADRPDYWQGAERVLCSLSFAKSRKRAGAVAAAAWDLVIVDEPIIVRTERRRTGSSSTPCSGGTCSCLPPRPYQTTCWNSTTF